MEKESSGNIFTAIISELFKLAGEMIGSFFSILPKALSFILWVLVACIVIPCTFVSNTIYPKWIEWGEKF